VFGFTLFLIFILDIFLSLMRSLKYEQHLDLVSLLNMRDKVGTIIRLVMNAEEMANIRSYIGSQST